MYVRYLASAVVSLAFNFLTIILSPLHWPHPDEFQWGVFIRYRGGNGVELFSYRHDLPLFGRRYCKIWLGWKQNGGRNVLALNINPFHSF